MLELLTFALFQLSILLGPSTPTVPTAEADTTVGSGGWGHDAQAPPTTQSCAEVGSGGWGHD